MRNIKSAFVFCFLFLWFADIQAQDKSNIKFGKIAVGDFSLTADKFDSGANAVIIADIGNTSFEGNDNGFFNTVFTRFLRVKIMNKNGYQIGDREIRLFSDADGDYEKLISVKASTYILQNGIVTETKLEEKAIFKEHYSKSIEIRKFSMPALKEGAIFELAYTIKSPFPARMMPWSFQGEYPILWSEYEVTIPSVFHFVMKMQGDQNFDVKTIKQIPTMYSIRYPHGIVQTGGFSLNTNSANIHWVKKNIPSLHEEPFTTTLDNYYSRVMFQLSFFQWSDNDEKQDFMSDWKSTSQTMIKYEGYEKAVNGEDYWMIDDVKNIIGDAVSDFEKIKRIYGYIRDNYKASGYNGFSAYSIYPHNSLKTIFKNKSGNVAEINLLLTGMLRNAGIRADPLILSTRKNGKANPGVPLIDEYNYVVCIAFPNNQQVVLDASRPFNGYGQLPAICYNGWGHLINPDNPLSINFSPDSLTENRETNILIFNDDNGKVNGTYKCILGRSESYNLRNEISASSVQSYEQKFRTESGSDLLLENFEIDSLGHYDGSATINYDFTLKSNSSTDIIYFDPVLSERYKTNPFSAIDRHYPVEIPYLIDERYLLNMDIPAGYQVDELPKSVRVNYNGKEGLFEYIIQTGKASLQLSMHLKLNKTFFPVEEYTTLRDFFSTVVKKENEKIVFKKIQ